MVLVRTNSIRMTPAIDAVVLHANSGDVDTVLVAGQCVKRDGKLVGADWPALSARLCASSERIVEGMRSVPLAAIEDLAAQMIPRAE